jgi:hypothetical protein
MHSVSDAPLGVPECHEMHECLQPNDQECEALQSELYLYTFGQLGETVGFADSRPHQDQSASWQADVDSTVPRGIVRTPELETFLLVHY